mmetsp:Transcript_34943/g.51102  ORF Transcript_34943/g.51102 Transcript_34943/m.51102 type:complete len:191 (-) Transcript_34943:52-624(-)
MTGNHLAKSKAPGLIESNAASPHPGRIMSTKTIRSNNIPDPANIDGKAIPLALKTFRSNTSTTMKKTAPPTSLTNTGDNDPPRVMSTAAEEGADKSRKDEVSKLFFLLCTFGVLCRLRRRGLNVAAAVAEVIPFAEGAAATSDVERVATIKAMIANPRRSERLAVIVNYECVYLLRCYNCCSCIQHFLEL